jgi:MSHA pilin protein MshD
MSFPACRQRGLTLIELIMFIVIVSVALVGVLTVLNVTVKNSADPMIRKQALAVAEAMLDEVLSKDFQNDPADPTDSSATLGCTPATAPSCRLNTPADRPNYNDVDDFNGWSQGVIQIDGTPAPVLGSYTVAINVAPLNLSGIDGKQVTVTVAGGNETIVLNGFRANF